jgi:ribonuclease HII
LTLERRLLRRGLVHIVGLDEAGRGAWAGPVVAGAVVLSPQDVIPEALDGVRDSKLLSPHRREELFDVIHHWARAVGVGTVASGDIDRKGIVWATREAMRRALSQLEVTPQHLLIDYLTLPQMQVPQWPVVHGDRMCFSIAAASIVAKVHRDRLLLQLDAEFPGYGFAQHKGYGTPAHRRAMAELGPSPIHRLSWVPCRELSSPSRPG